MKKIFFIQLITFSILCLFYLSLQNDVIYKKSLGQVSDNWQNTNGEPEKVDKPYIKLTNTNYIQWDAAHYFLIKKHGYGVKEAGGDYIFAFFPLFPTIWRITHLPPIGILFLNYLFLSISMLILLKLFSERKDYLKNVIISFSFPSIIIFFIPYTEATYLLMVSIGIYGFVKDKYWIFFFGLLFASLTRPSYTFLIFSILGVELFFLLYHKKILLFLRNFSLRILPLFAGTALVSAIQFSQGSGEVFKFIQVQKYWKNILSIPHNLRDWSHEGFAINIGVLFLVFAPLLIILVRLFYRQVAKKKATGILDYKNPVDYLTLLSALYLIGNTLFIIFFRGGSLHCLFRFTLCSPFLFILIFGAFRYVAQVEIKTRRLIYLTASVVSIVILSSVGYSRSWNFSDFGIILFISNLALWTFQDYSSERIYRIGLFSTFTLNLIWTTFLFNTYISNGWIFA